MAARKALTGAAVGRRRTRARWRRGSASDVVVVLEVLVLGEGDDGVQYDMTETLVQVASLIASWNDSEVRPELVLSPTSFWAPL